MRRIDIVNRPMRGIISNGYILTEKARKTEEYKRAWREERRLFKECFGIDIGGDNGWLK